MSGSYVAAAEPNYAALGDDSTDDLPRTFRREKEARAREAREQAARERAAAPTLSTAPDYSAAAPRVLTDTPAKAAAAAATGDLTPATVRAIDVPFAQLVLFFLKAVLAAVPAMILLMAILWGLGHLLQMFFPDLIKMKILIGVG